MWYSSNGLVALDLFSMFQFLVIILSSVLPIGWKVVIIQYKHAISYCWQGAHFTFGPNEQNQHVAELSQQVCLNIQVLVRQRGLPSLDGKLRRFITEQRKKRFPNQVRQTITLTKSQESSWHYTTGKHLV